MKKVFTRIMLIALASIMCIGLAACSHSADAKSIKGEKVTKDEWADAFEALLKDDVEYTAEYYMETKVDYYHKTMVHTTKWGAKMSLKMTDIKKDSKEHITGTNKISISGDKDSAEDLMGIKAKTEDIDQYGETVNGRLYVYEKGKDGKWKKEEAYGMTDELATMKSLISYAKDAYSYFEYSNDLKGYVSKDYEEWDDIVSVFKFKDGKLVALYSYAKNVDIDEAGQEYEITKSIVEQSLIIDYSAKDITLPKVG